MIRGNVTTLFSEWANPLYKIHNLTLDEIRNKVIPPFRLVTAAQNFPTARIEKWLCNIISPVANKYCEKEIIRDSQDFLAKISNMEDILSQSGMFLFTVDVNKLYPSIDTEILQEALEDALLTCTYGILGLAKVCFESAAVQFGDNWFKQIFGLTTGGSASVPWANIFMKHLLRLFRFIDDLFGGFIIV